MTLEEVGTQGQGEVRSEVKICTSKSDRPLTWSEWRDRAETVEATKEVPENLRVLWSDLSVSQEIAVQTIKRSAGSQPEPIPGHRPEWVASIVKPLPAPRLSRPRLQHRGVPVDPLVVWGADDRRIYNDTSYPWGCVCRVLSSGQGSGVLIGPRHVLTASHIMNWKNGRATVEVHRAGETVAATAKVIAAVAVTAIGNVGATTVDEDYAVLVLDQRLGDRFGWMGIRTYDSSWDDEDYWFSIGYPGDIADGSYPVWQREKELDEDEADLGGGRAMTTAADLKPGQSGSPMFGFWPDSPYVVAVVSAEGQVFVSGTENWCSGGSDLTRLVINALNNYP